MLELCLDYIMRMPHFSKMNTSCKLQFEEERETRYIIWRILSDFALSAGLIRRVADSVQASSMGLNETIKKTVQGISLTMAANIRFA